MLKDIISIIEQETGLNASETTQRTHIINHVNLAAKRLHESTDLEGSSISKDFNLSVGSALVAFPPEVGIVRKLRYVESRVNIEVGDERARFHESGYTDANCLRIITKEYQPLSRDIENVGKLTFNHPAAEDFDIIFFVVGGNDKTAQQSETVTLPAGQTTVSTKKTYSKVTRLMRDTDASYDTQITDLTGIELAIFPTAYRNLQHQVVRLAEAIHATTEGLTTRGVEVYFKKALTYMFNDLDSFVCNGDMYDEVLAWEYIKRFGPTDKQEKALEHLSKSLTDIARDQDKGKSRRIDVAPSRIGNALRNNRMGYYRKY